MYFHEGIDIRPVDGGIAVYPVEDGKITAVLSDAVAYNSFMVVETNANVGWNYIHMVPGTDPTGKAWAAGMLVTGGGNPGKSQIGVVAATDGTIAQHLHLDYGGGVDPYLAALQTANPAKLAPEVAKVRRPIDDPLTKMPNLADAIRPTVEGDIHFRVAEHDRNGELAWAETGLPLSKPQPDPLRGVAEQSRLDNHYFKQDVQFFHPWRWVGALAPTKADDAMAPGAAAKHRIDIIAGAYDKMIDDVLADQVGVKRIGFSITGMGAQTGDIMSFDFSGEFTRGGIIGGNPRPATQDYGGLRDYKHARVVYENDSYSDSIMGWTNWYTVTNTPSVNATAARVEEANRERYWNSKVAIGKDWNDPGNEAAVNAQARFPDGFYRVNVWAEDAKDNKSVALDKRVILDNFAQKLKAEGLPAQPGDPPGLVRVRFSGENWLANSTVPVSYVNALQLQSGVTISSVGYYLTTLQTDSNGNIPPTDYAFTPSGGPYPWVFLADYAGGDDVYEPQLDADALLEVGQGGEPLSVMTMAVAADWAQQSDSSASPAPQPGPAANPGSQRGRASATADDPSVRLPARTRSEAVFETVRIVSVPVHEPSDAQLAGVGIDLIPALD